MITQPTKIQFIAWINKHHSFTAFEFFTAFDISLDKTSLPSRIRNQVYKFLSALCKKGYLESIGQLSPAKKYFLSKQIPVTIDLHKHIYKTDPVTTSIKYHLHKNDFKEAQTNIDIVLQGINLVNKSDAGVIDWIIKQQQSYLHKKPVSIHVQL